MITQTETAHLPLTLAERRLFLKLPLAERRWILAKQAERAAAHYEQEPERSERIQMQGGDIVAIVELET